MQVCAGTACKLKPQGDGLNPIGGVGRRRPDPIGRAVTGKRKEHGLRKAVTQVISQ